MTKITHPLAKSITTLEGQLSVVTSVVIGLAGSPVLHALNPKVAAAALVVNNVALLAQRGLVKAQALQSDVLVEDLESGDWSEVVHDLEGQPAVVLPQSSVKPDLAPGA